MASVAMTCEWLKLDAAKETDRIVSWIREKITDEFRRKGAVIGLSGGVDSTVAAYLCVRALGARSVHGLLMPEVESSSDSLVLGRLVAKELGIEATVEDVSAMLLACGCYRRRDDAVRTLIPEYSQGWRCKLVLPSLTDGDRYAVFSVVAESPQGKRYSQRVTLNAYREILAASNLKQRTRKLMEYTYADRLNFAVVGTPNRLEYDQGFFVKNGDGAADLKPIAHLYKSQVYQLAEYLEVPREIVTRPPTTDTYSLEQTQEEFYFSLPLATFDLCLWGCDHGLPAEKICGMAGLTLEQAERVYRSIRHRRMATRYQRLAPLMVEKVCE